MLVFGGSMHADQDDRHPWLIEENSFIQGLLERQVPMLGVCLGIQLFAKAEGAAVYPLADGPEIGWFPVELTAAAAADPLFARLPVRAHPCQAQLKTLSWDFRYLHNGADFYDLFGPVERSRHGDSLFAGYNKTIIYDPPRQLDLFGSAAVYTGLERLPNAQNIASPRTIASLEAGAKYTNTRKSLGGVDHEKGIAWRALADLDYAQDNLFPKLYGGVDYGIPLPLANSSLWVYAHAGVAGGRRSSPLSAFYFGAFRNNYVDDRPEKRYREMESFPGFSIDEIAARRFAKLTGEINLPPLRFAEAGTPAFFLSHVRPAIFGGGMATAAPDGSNHRYYDLGAQLDLNFTVALRLPMVLSVGAAGGWRDGHYRKTEWLASLKVLRHVTLLITQGLHWGLALIPVLIMLTIFVWLDAFKLMSLKRGARPSVARRSRRTRGLPGQRQECSTRCRSASRSTAALSRHGSRRRSRR